MTKPNRSPDEYLPNEYPPDEYPPDEYPSVLLLPTAGLGQQSWDAVIERIPGFAHAIAIDLPRHRDIPRGARRSEVVPLLAERVAEEAAALGLHRPHVVGHSLGGAIALELARQIPVAAVTAICTIGFRAVSNALMDTAKMWTQVRMAGAVSPGFRQRLLDKTMFRRIWMSGLSARPSALHCDVAAADITSMVGSDLLAMARRTGRYVFRTPELAGTTQVNLVWADQDRVVPLSDSIRARRAFPGAGHLVMPGSGHLVMRDDPDGTAAVILACHDQALRAQRRDFPRFGNQPGITGDDPG